VLNTEWPGLAAPLKEERGRKAYLPPLRCMANFFS
jgi:hypothetical protein